MKLMYRPETLEFEQLPELYGDQKARRQTRRMLFLFSCILCLVVGMTIGRLI
jgi:hypothetical protein